MALALAVVALVVAVAQDAVEVQDAVVERVAALALTVVVERVAAELLRVEAGLLRAEAELLRAAAQSETVVQSAVAVRSEAVVQSAAEALEAAEVRTASAAEPNWDDLDVYDDSHSSLDNGIQECKDGICGNPGSRIPVLAPDPFVEIRGYLEALELAEAPSVWFEPLRR